MILLEGVSKSYGAGESQIRAVEDISLQVGPGEFLVISGPSGSGKTTLLNLIGGLTRPDRGRIVVAGREVPAMKDAEASRFRARTIGFVFQFQSMLPTLSALDNVRLPLLFSGGGSGQEEALSLLTAVGLAGRARSFSQELSAGQQRRVGIARALINRPALLLLDEPTGDLDPETESAIMTMIARAHDEGTTVLMTTHNPWLRRYATRRLQIKDGRIEGTAGPG